MEYAAKKDIIDGIVKKYHLELLEPPESADDEKAYGGQNQQTAETYEPIASNVRNTDKYGSGNSYEKNRTSVKTAVRPPINTICFEKYHLTYKRIFCPTGGLRGGSL